MNTKGLIKLAGVQAELEKRKDKLNTKRGVVTSQLALRYSNQKTFPAPVIDIPRARFWKASDVSKWMKEHFKEV
jgi:hypothetical protein